MAEVDDRVRDILRRLVEDTEGADQFDDGTVQELIDRFARDYAVQIQSELEQQGWDEAKVLLEDKDWVGRTAGTGRLESLRADMLSAIQSDVAEQTEVFAAQRAEVVEALGLPDSTVVTLERAIETSGVKDPAGSVLDSLAAQHGQAVTEALQASGDPGHVADMLGSAPETFIERTIPSSIRSLRDTMLANAEATANRARATADQAQADSTQMLADARSEATQRMQTGRSAATSTPRTARGPSGLTPERLARLAELNERIRQVTSGVAGSDAVGSLEADKAERDALEARQQRTGDNPSDVAFLTELSGGATLKDGGATLKDPLDLSFLNDPEWQEMLGLATPSYDGGGYYGGSPRLSAAQQAEADRTEVQALLAEQFGGYAFFFEKNNAGLRVGIDANGKIVDHADPNAVSQKNVLDVIVDQGIVDPSRINGILQKTEWWQTTDSKMRFFDATFGELSEPGKQEFLEPITDLLAEEAQFLGFQLDPARARQMAETIARQGEENDQDFIRGLMVAESAFDAVGTEISEFAAARDSVQQMARQYFVPIGDEDAARFAEEIYVGDRTGEAMQQYFKEQAISRFPTLEAAITQQNITPEQYFAPYKYEIERMLDRPNVNILEDFADIIEYVPDTGGDNPRPMTLAETRKFIRGTNEWQASTQGQDQAQALAFAIGRTFGEDA